MQNRIFIRRRIINLHLFLLSTASTFDLFLILQVNSDVVQQYARII